MIPLTQNIIVGVVIGAVSGLIGAFVILRRMALVGDAMSHVALPGVALALMFSLDPFWGALVFLLGAAVVVWLLESRTRLPAEAIVGLLFTASLAVGILLIPDAEILESLFGKFEFFSALGLLAVILVSLSIIAATIALSKSLILDTLSRELASLSGRMRLNTLVFFLLFALVISLGIKLVGTLLMGALTIIPASMARNVTRSMGSYLLVSMFSGVFISLGGIMAAWKLAIAPGPAIVLVGIGVFIITLVFKR